jgi:hypothetical protein
MKIFTFYNHVDGFDVTNEEKLLRIWARSWANHGWDPVVLNEAQAAQHPEYPEFRQRIPMLPTINGHGYEDACYARWMAVATQGGGMMCDYDVLNYGFLPEDTKAFRRLTILSRIDSTLGNGSTVANGPEKSLADEEQVRLENTPNCPPQAIFGWAVPCAVWGSADEYMKVARLFMTHTPGKFDVMFGRQHCSDQTILTYYKYSNLYDITRTCIYYSHPGWETAKLVHYANGVMGPNNLWPRCEHVEKLRPM